MVTGIEVAGVAFGLFPIVIEGIECYISSAEKVKEMLHHRRTLDEFRRELEMEKSIFDNIRCTLEDRAGVLIEPNMEFPQKIMEEVLSCLPQSAVASFVNGCQELNTILRELTERFQKFEQDMVGVITFWQGCITNYQLTRQVIARCLQCFNILKRKIEISALSAYTG